MTQEDTEGDVRTFATVQSQLEWLSSQVWNRNKYLGVPPWSFCKTDTVQGADDFLKQVAKRPLAEHDPLTRLIMHLHGARLVVASNGGAQHPDLVEYQRRFNLAQLDESGGERYHVMPQLERKTGTCERHTTTEAECKGERLVRTPQRIHEAVRRTGQGSRPFRVEAL